MPRTEAVNQEIRDQQRLNILRAALKVFAQMGWQATMADIAKQANISQGLAYRYFEGKEIIFLEILDRVEQEGHLAYFLQDGNSPKERLRNLITRLLDPGSVDMAFYQVAMQMFRSKGLPESLQPRTQDLVMQFREVIKQLIVEGQANKEFVVGDPEQLTIATLAMMNGLTLFGLRNQEQIMRHFPDASIVMRILVPWDLNQEL